MTTTAVWFGDSWCLGTELEKCIGPDYTSKDQESYRRENRFSRLVSENFGWEEVNLGQEGISPEHVMLKVVEYGELQGDREDQIYFIVWPSFQRYFWIDELGIQHDLRWSTSDKSWYRVVDNYDYQMYCARRTVWATTMYLKSKGLRYFMVNNQYRLEYANDLPLDTSGWMLPPTRRLGDLLDVDLDNGFPDESKRHRYFWPCQSHPNQYGHKHLANEIINYLKEEGIICQS
jgi:hypothetical protein